MQSSLDVATQGQQQPYHASSQAQVRKHNFSGEQCALPREVLQSVEREWFNVGGVGVTMLEMFNKQPKYLKYIEQGEAALRELLSIPSDFRIYTMHGGQALQISAVPLNLLGNSNSGTATYLNTGYWSERAINEAKKYVSTINVAANLTINNTQQQQVIVAESAAIPADTAYVHYVSDEPVDGIQLLEYPKRPSEQRTSNTVIVADLSGDFLTRRVDWSSIDVAYVSSEYQAGIAGSTLLIIRDAVIRTPHAQCPYMIDYAALKGTDGLPNTPPTFPMYVNAKVFLHAASMGGIDVISARISAFAKRIYGEIDAFPAIYECKVHDAFRSNVHIVFRVKPQAMQHKMDLQFAQDAAKVGIVGLEFRRSDALRVSLNLSTTDQAVDAIVNFMQDFALRMTASSVKPQM